jgi:predicted O-methyltransferase YrrM
MTNKTAPSAKCNPTMLSSAKFKYFPQALKPNEIVDSLSDLKHRVFPRPFERLAKIHQQKDLTGVEIGVCGGEHALSLLENLSIKRLYLIDPYDMYEDYSEGKKHYGVDQPPLDQTELLARELLKKHQDKIVWIRKLSADAVKDISEKIDFVYIDGNHAEPYVKEDIENYFPLLKKGGVIGGHDFYNGFQREHDGVINAVVKFVARTNLQLQVELPDWWIET